MSGYFKQILSFIFFVAILNATHALSFHRNQTAFQHQSAAHHPFTSDQPVSLTIEDGSDEEFIGQQPIQSIQPDEKNMDKIHFMITTIPEKPVFPFRRPPKIS